MKKLIISAVAVAISVVAGAASIDWQVAAGSFKNAAGTTASGVQSYLLVFASSEAADTLYSSLADGTTSFASAISTYSVGSAQGEVSTSSKSAGAISTTLVNSKLTAAETYYFAVFSTEGSQKFILSSTKTGKTYDDDPDTGTAAKFSSSQFSKTADTRSGWTAVSVPEPTSGLLLLLGMAGLALRRRRA